jgi:arylsulfatase A-like enzyme
MTAKQGAAKLIVIYGAISHHQAPEITERDMSRPKNVLWIMCDQLRYDYLGCTGHPTLKTPNIDAMAKRGVRFSNAYVQSPICGPSRMSFYTGRYMRSHGSHWNGWPLRVGEPTLGDHLKKIGVRNVLVGKTHMAPDLNHDAKLHTIAGADKGPLRYLLLAIPLGTCSQNPVNECWG